MSIDKVEVTNAQGNLLILSLEDISSGYVVEDVDGLGPVKATIASSAFAGLDGVQYQSSRRDGRSITIKLSYAPDFSTDQTVDDLRDGLYRFFMTDTMVDLAIYKKNGLTVKISGLVESCEPVIFTPDPEMSVSIFCFNPDFVAADPVTIHDLLTTIDTVGHPISVTGTVKRGLDSISFTAPKALSEFTIYHTAPSGKLYTMLVSAPLLTGDVVNIRTVVREKSITLTRSGVTTSLLYAVSPQSVWTLLEPGENLLYLKASDTGPSAPVLLEFTNHYGGL